MWSSLAPVRRSASAVVEKPVTSRCQFDENDRNDEETDEHVPREQLIDTEDGHHFRGKRDDQDCAEQGGHPGIALDPLLLGAHRCGNLQDVVATAPMSGAIYEQSDHGADDRADDARCLKRSVGGIVVR